MKTSNTYTPLIWEVKNASTENWEVKFSILIPELENDDKIEVEINKVYNISNNSQGGPKYNTILVVVNICLNGNDVAEPLGNLGSGMRILSEDLLIKAEKCVEYEGAKKLKLNKDFRLIVMHANGFSDNDPADRKAVQCIFESICTNKHNRFVNFDLVIDKCPTLKKNNKFSDPKRTGNSILIGE